MLKCMKSLKKGSVFEFEKTLYFLTKILAPKNLKKQNLSDWSVVPSVEKKLIGLVLIVGAGWFVGGWRSIGLDSVARVFGKTGHQVRHGPVQLGLIGLRKNKFKNYSLISFINTR